MKKILMGIGLVFCVACASLPTSVEYTQRGDGYFKDGKPKKALAAYNRAIELNPENLEAYASRGTVHFFEGNFALAEKDFKYVLSKNPYHADAYTALGSALAAQGDYGSALQMFDRALLLKPNRPETVLSRAGVYFVQGRYEQAVADYSAVLRYYPAAEVYQARGVVYQQMGRKDLAEKDFATAREVPMPQTLSVYNMVK